MDFYHTRLNEERDTTMDNTLDWIEISLFALSIVLLIVVYFIIRSQLQANKVSQKLLYENKQLLQSITDNTSSPIFIKKIKRRILID
jgi:hypothetical protein